MDPLQHGKSLGSQDHRRSDSVLHRELVHCLWSAREGDHRHGTGVHLGGVPEPYGKKECDLGARGGGTALVEWFGRASRWQAEGNATYGDPRESVIGHAEMAEALAAVLEASNSDPASSGYSPAQAMLGKQPRGLGQDGWTRRE